MLLVSTLVVNNKDDKSHTPIFYCSMQVDGDWFVGHERRNGLGPQLDHQPAEKSWQGEWQRQQQCDPQGRRPLLGEEVCRTHGLQALVCRVSAQLPRGRLLTQAFHTTNHTIECDIQISLRSCRERAAAQAWW